MTAVKGLLEALVLVVIAAVVAAVAAGIWVAAGDGTFVSRLGICLVAAGALVALTGGLGLTKMGGADTFAWFGHAPERETVDDGRVLTGIGIFLFVTIPLVVLGGFFATL
ncbi:hypothetical protein GCM10022251_26270 [Phytohabitans flavus]|uniref:Uncharacterized protein n=1 Tax=Phytohabitans flavus TaxID=1076124 RepID=A0A6F8XPQ7_9ACTN|nr:hypothetical protein [Phytohabitans flavus]BCB75779.1 hypothetical protein Pflav_021890 [Phytohabitans flavus]